MDIYCPVCGELGYTGKLWEFKGMSYEDARIAFAITGCFKGRHNKTPNKSEIMASRIASTENK